MTNHVNVRTGRPERARLSLLRPVLVGFLVAVLAAVPAGLAFGHLVGLLVTWLGGGALGVVLAERRAGRQSAFARAPVSGCAAWARLA